MPRRVGYPLFYRDDGQNLASCSSTPNLLVLSSSLLLLNIQKASGPASINTKEKNDIKLYRIESFAAPRVTLGPCGPSIQKE